MQSALTRYGSVVLTTILLVLPLAQASEPSAPSFDALSRCLSVLAEDQNKYAQDLFVDWNNADAWVLGELNSDATVEAINSQVRQLPGYSAEERVDQEVIGNIAFSKSPFVPGVTYSVFGFKSDGQDYVLAQWSPGYGYTPTRLSIYRQEQGRWRKSHGLQSEWKILAYPFPASPSPDVFVTIEFRRFADCAIGKLKVWRIKDGRLKLLHYYRPDLLDYQAAVPEPNGLTVDYDEQTKSFWGGFMGTRNRCRVIIRMGIPEPTVERQTLTPWVETVDRCIGAIRAGRKDEATGFFVTPSLTPLIPAAEDQCVRIVSEEGELESGRASVTLRYAEGAQERDLLLRLRRVKEGNWVIVDARPTPVQE